MTRRGWVVVTVVVGGIVAFIPWSRGALPPPKANPKPEAVAETKLLMDGLNQSNFRGLERLLAKKPDDVEAWKFARGQALLIAETGNLLMLRPPKNAGETAWMEQAVELRDSATALAKVLAERNYEQSRQGLIKLAGTCNKCHQTFRVAVRLTPFEESGDK